MRFSCLRRGSQDLKDGGNRSFVYYHQRLFAHAFCEAMQGNWGKVAVLVYWMAQGFWTEPGQKMLDTTDRRRMIDRS